MKYTIRKSCAGIIISICMISGTFLPVDAQEIKSDTESVCVEVNEETTGEAFAEEQVIPLCSTWSGVLEEGTRCYYDEKGQKVTGLQEIDGYTYYFNEEGILQTGWQRIGEKSIIFPWRRVKDMKKKIVVIDEITYSFNSEGDAEKLLEDNGQEEDSVVEDEVLKKNSDEELENNVQKHETEEREEEKNLDTDVARAKTGWVYSNDGDGRKYYILPNGQKHTGWLSFGKTYYYCGTDGAVVCGKYKIGDSWYYFNEAGIRQESKWIMEDGKKKYYAMPDGKLRMGWLSFGKTYYYCRLDGNVAYGKLKIGDSWYYFNEAGVRQENRWIIEDGKKKYYAMSDGKLRMGWLSFGKTYYYCRLDGSIAYGKLKIEDSWYYFNEAGVRQENRWIMEDGKKKYYAMPDGKLRIGWLSFGKTYYYCRLDGDVAYGKLKIKDSWYYFNEAGIRQQGQWVKEDGKNKYYAMPDGKLRTGWLSFGTTYYYCKNDAEIMRSQTDFPIDGIKYTFDANGVMKREGGWGSYNGEKYYKNPEKGMPYKNQWVSFGKTYYYANAKGYMVSGWQTIGGYRYYFDPSTKIMARNTTIDGIRIGADGKADTVYTKAANILNRIGWSLSAAFNWSASMPYSWTSATAAPGSEWFANYGFTNGYGDCYVMAGSFCYLARALGYEAHQMDGYVPSRSGGATPHSWVEVVINGSTYVFDPDFTHETGRNGYQISYGTSGTWVYSGYRRIN